MSAAARRISFRVAIVTAVVGLLVVTSGFLLVYGLSTGARSMNRLKGEYLDQIADTSVREVARLPQTAAQVLRVQRYRIETGFYQLSDPMSVARGFAGALQTDPDILWVSYSEAATGRFIGAHRITGDEFVLNLSDPRVDRGVPREYRADSGEAYVRTPPITEPYEPRTRDWYLRGMAAAGSVVWMPPYTFAEGVKGITAAMAVLGREGQVEGVLTVDFSLVGLQRFLGRIKLGRRGVVALFDSQGALLTGTVSARSEAAARAIESLRRGAEPMDDAVRHAEARVGGETWDVAARSLALAPGLQWIVAAALPDSDFMGAIYAGRRRAVAIVLVFLAVAVVVGFLLASGMARSLGRATQALDRAARFEPGTVSDKRSAIREVAQLEDAVGRVTASLNSFSRYAPEEIVRDVVLSGREAILSGERRDVTVLFSDLRGFTAFAEQIRPEEVVAILNDHFELLVGTIVQHRGFVVDFLGDAVFAVFGAPEPATDHVEQAVACAIEIQRARAARNTANRARGWPPLEMGVGIDTGPAVVGNMGSARRIKYGVVGHIVNTAARIETLTVGGQALVSDAVRRALGDRLMADGPMEAESKGVGATMLIWEVLALRGETMLVLPSAVHELPALSRPLDATLRVYLGKQLDKQSHAARVLRLGAAGAELVSQAPLALFSAVNLQLSDLAGSGTIDGIDGKVVELSEHDGAPMAVVRFTGVGWDARDRLEALARGAGGAAASGPRA